MPVYCFMLLIQTQGVRGKASQVPALERAHIKSYIPALGDFVIIVAETQERF